MCPRFRAVVVAAEYLGLLNNDCLWMLDEIQLMGTGLATSTQLQAFRESLGTFGAVKTVWMSATLLPGWLGSVDYRDRIEPDLRLGKLALDPKTDYQADGLRERWNAKKPVEPATLSASNVDVGPADHTGFARPATGEPLEFDQTADVTVEMGQRLLDNFIIDGFDGWEFLYVAPSLLEPGNGGHALIDVGGNQLFG